MTSPESRNYKTGEAVESESFGLLDKKAVTNVLERSYLPFSASINVVKGMQSEDPTNPRAPFARDLRIEIIDALGIEDPAEYDKVRFYTALGSALDHYHGVDGFVEIDHGDTTERVTLDITTREKVSWKADILIVLPPGNLDPDLDEKEYLAMIEKVTQSIVRKVNTPDSRQFMVHFED